MSEQEQKKSIVVGALMKSTYREGEQYIAIDENVKAGSKISFRFKETLEAQLENPKSDAQAAFLTKKLEKWHENKVAELEVRVSAEDYSAFMARKKEERANKLS